MKHPTHEELTEFIYRESSPARHLEIAQHLEDCTECREHVDAWHQTRAALKNWTLSKHAPAPQKLSRPAVRVAAAAIVLICAGYIAGRASAPGPRDFAALKSQVIQEVQQDLQSERAAQRLEYQRALASAAQQLEERRLADYASLRQDVETVAYHTQEKFDSLAGVVPDDRNVRPSNP